MKTAHRIAAVALACLAAPHALAQRVAPVVERYEPQDWTLHAEVFLDAYPPRGQGGVRYARSYEIQSAAVVFPLLEESASHETHIDRLRSQLVFEDRVMDDQPTLLDDYQSGERLGRWDLPKVRGSNLRLQLDLPMRAWKIRFNEQRAMSIPWPQNELGPIPASALRSQAYVEADDPDVVALVRRWTRGNPRAVPPAMLAKALAGEVINHFQPNGQGYEFGRNGRFEGFEIRGAAYAARRGRDTPYDMIALLA
ncbi:MAG: hypothetical protein VYC34_05715, partial [Planctomycetota bacterium]|nr:hypothetical protein [Planctomycetota bacterium]